MLYGRGVQVVGQIALIPILLSGWGLSGYGAWVAITAIASYFSFSSVGIGTVVRSEMAISFSRQDLPTMSTLYSTAIIFAASMGFILWIAVFYLGGLFIPQSLVDTGVVGDPSRVLNWLSLQVVSSVVGGTVFGALSALGKYALAQLIDSTRLLLELVIVASAVFVFDIDLEGAAFIMAATSVGGAFCGVACLRGAAPWFGVVPTVFSVRHFRAMLRPMAGAVLLGATQMGIMVQGPRLLLSMTASPASVAVYNVIMAVMRFPRMASETAAFAISMEFSFAHGRGDLSTVRKLLVGSTSISSWLMIISVPIIVGIGPWFIELWTHGQVRVGADALLIAAVGSLIYAFGVPSQQALQAVNGLARPAMLVMFLTPVIVLLFVATGVRSDTMSVLVLMLILEGIFAVSLVAFAANKFGIPMMLFMKSALKPPYGIIANEVATVRKRFEQARLP